MDESAESSLPSSAILPKTATARLEFLHNAYSELTHPDRPRSEATDEYVRHGNSLRLCMGEIRQLTGPAECDKQIAQARSNYILSLINRPRLRRHGGKEITDRAQADYVDSIVAKITAILAAETPEQALDLFQMPTIVAKTTFSDDEELSLERLAGNHLYVLVDTALKEHIERRALIENYKRRHGLARILGSRAARLTVAGGILLSSLSPKFNWLPDHGDLSSDNVDLGLQILSGTILAIDLPEAARLGYLDIKHSKETKKLHEQMASTKQDSDLALRIVYNSTRRGGTREVNLVTERFGTDDKNENLRRFALVEREIPHMNNDPGGKPYSGDQALGYAARLLIERRQQLQDIIDPSKSASEQRDLYLNLVREIIVEDLIRMRKGLSASKLRKLIMNGAAIGLSVIMPGQLSTASEAFGLTRDTNDVISGQTTVKELDP